MASRSAEAGVSDFLYLLNAQESSSYCVAKVVQTDVPGTWKLQLRGSRRIRRTVLVGRRPREAEVVVVPAAQPGPDAVPSTGLIQGANASGATAVLLDVACVVTTGGSCTEGVRAERKIRVTLTRSTYLNYAYFTDVETQDPAEYSPTLSSEFSSIPTAQQDATQYCSNSYY